MYRFAALLGVVVFACGCYSGPGTSSDGGLAADVPCVPVPMPDGGPVVVQGVVLDSKTDSGIPGAMIAAEYGGIYLDYCDRSHASPYYQFGGVTDGTGHFTVNAREGLVGFHSFANGYLYSRALTDTTQSGGAFVTLQNEPVAAGQTLPTVTNPAFAQTTVSAGATVSFSATLATYASTDPLSDENILVESTTGFATELDPPTAGTRDNFPNGLWKTTFTAPQKPGTYTYWFSATTAKCYTSQLDSLQLVVQ